MPLVTRASDVSSKTPKHLKAHLLKALLHQCPGCWAVGYYFIPKDGWIECNCGEQMTLVDLRAKQSAS